MKKSFFALGLFVLLAGVFPSSVGAASLPVNSGLWSPQWLATYQRMRSENHVWWTLINNNCALSGTSGQRYSDNGMWCTIVYKVTGDTTAAQKAATRWLAANPQVANDNHRREEFVDACIQFSALRPTLTPTQEATWLNRLNAWATQSLGTRLVDGDQTIGTTLGMQCLDQVAGTNWSAQIAPMIAKTQGYINGFAGGELDESMEYNSGTSVLLMMGIAMLPPNTYSNVDTFLRDHAKYHPFSVTGDLRQYVQWWDDQNPRDFTGRLFRKMTNWMVTQGMTLDPSLQQLITSTVTKYGATGYQSAEPWARSFLFYDPYAPVGVVVNGLHLSTARGHLYTRTPNTTVFLVASNPSNEDHEWHWTFNAEVYRDGEWVITMPRSYGEWPAYRGEGSNGLSLAGLGAMSSRGMTRAETGQAGGVPWSSISGETNGPLYDAGTYDPPPSYVNYAGRTSFTTEVNGWTVLITRDMVDMKDPRTLPKFNRYRNSGLWMHQQWITAAEGLPWTVWHSPVQPTRTGDQIAWTTPGGQSVTIDFYSDASIRDVMVDEKTLVGIAASEQKWHTKLNTSAPVLWSVVRIGRGTPPAISRSGDTITVGARAVKITPTAITVDGLPGTAIPITPAPTTPPPTVPTPTSPTPISTKFKVGDRVKVISALNVRGSASVTGALLGTQAINSSGTVLSGGASADGYYWWNINYDTGVDGWSAENLVTLSLANPAPTDPTTSPTPIPAPTPVPTPTPTPTLTTSTKFKAGDRITAGDTVNIRTQPDTKSPLVGTRPKGSLGTIVSGGIKENGYFWWNVNYDNSNIDGWTIENYISKAGITAVTSPEPTPAPTPTPTPEPSIPDTTPALTPTNNTSITSGSDYVEFTIGSTAGYSKIGLSNNDSSTSDSSVDFGFNLSVWKTYKCAAYGASLKGCGGTFKAGDVFRVNRSGDTITYIRNGETLLTWTRGAWQKALVFPLKLDTSTSPAETAAASDSLPISKQMYILILGALLLGGIGLIYRKKAR